MNDEERRRHENSNVGDSIDNRIQEFLNKH